MVIYAYSSSQKFKKIHIIKIISSHKRPDSIFDADRWIQVSMREGCCRVRALNVTYDGWDLLIFKMNLMTFIDIYKVVNFGKLLWLYYA